MLGAAPLALGAPSAFAQDQTLNYREADIQAFIDDVSMFTGRMFIVDPRVKGKVSVYAQQPISPDEVFQVFLSTLRVYGFTAIPTSTGAFKIVPDETAAQDANPVGAAQLEGDQVVTEVFQLAFAQANEVAATLRPLVNRQGQVTASPRTNSLIVVDYAQNMRRIRQVVSELDQDASVIETVQLRNTTAGEMARIIASLSGSGAEGGLKGLNYSVVAVESSNSLLIKGEQAAIDQLKPIIRRLDRISESNTDLGVIYLKYADAEQLVPILDQVSRSLSETAPGGEDGPSRPAGIAFHQPTNALIINADQETQRALAGVIRQLDIRRAQVLVEAIIVEISDVAARQLGVQYVLSGTDESAVPFSSTNFSRSAPDVLALTGVLINESESGGDENDDGLFGSGDTLGQAAVSSLLALNGLSFGFAGERDGTLFGFILNAVDDDTASNVLSTPSVMTLDNESASIIVGQEIPITTGSSLGDNNVNPFQTIQREDVGVQLEVRPQINEGDSIKLFIRQEVSSIAGAVSDSNPEIITNRREISTTVLADDGEIIVLGGLIEEDEQISEEKVPVLGDIPVIGRLFASKGRSNERTNLMVFIRPTIVRDVEDARAVTSRKYNYLQAEQLLRTREPTSSMERFTTEILGRDDVPSIIGGEVEPSGDVTGAEADDDYNKEGEYEPGGAPLKVRSEGAPEAQSLDSAKEAVQTREAAPTASEIEQR
ncbi:MAG: type II secretion system secretin GspD [Pseudomonadota bacterium]